MLKPGTVLCGEGFNYKRQKDNKLKFLEHKYGVTIERNCTIGANSVIDRGRHRDTVIGKGTKMDNQVYVAHNVLIGENCIIGAHSSILGSVEIGNNCEIWTGTIIHQGVKIGDNSIVGANSYIRHNIPPDTVVYCSWKYVTTKPKKESKKYA